MKLTIYIPSYGRDELDPLLASLTGHGYPDVEIIVSDDTPEGVSAGICAQYPDVEYRHRRYNVGRDANIMGACVAGSGEYIWCVGDDEEFRHVDGIHPVQRVLGALETQPGRLILLTEEAVPHVPWMLDWTYQTPDLLQAMMDGDASLLIATTLISSNVFRRATIDLSLGLHWWDTYYPYAFATIPAATTKILGVPIMRCGWHHQQTIPNIAGIWDDYLTELCVYHGTPLIPIRSAVAWNFANLAQRART